MQRQRARPGAWLFFWLTNPKRAWKPKVLKALEIGERGAITRL
jgi:hypothetical protein